LVWTIEYADSARRQLLKSDMQTARQLIDYMGERFAVMDNPRDSGKALTGPLGGLWRFRIKDWRVICDIQDGALRVLVLQIGNRREIYRQ
jgi:mRNA interferase RelE/StbE